MKKLLLCAATAAALCLGACSGNGASEKQGALNLLSAADADSLCQAFGTMAGSQIANQFGQAMQADSTLSKDMFIRGMEYALAGDTATSYAYGMNIGLNLMNQIKYFEGMGVKVDRDALIKSFKTAFMQDSVKPEAATEAQMQYQALFGKLREAKKAYDDSIKAASPEAIANVKAGEAYVDSVKKADPAVKTSETGLSYKIENAGDTAKIKTNERVLMKYVGKTAAGVEFDKADENNMRPMPVGSLVSGMKEGLQMLGKGGKATFYIPGKLAYGVDGMPRVNIGPNEMLVFEVEIVDIPSRTPVKVK